MKAFIIDKISEDTATCFLIKAKLADYINAIPEDYRSYEVQREIVKNTYLDNLIQTILDGRHIPQMVLVSDQSVEGQSGEQIKAESFKILDGLQRTYRLKAIFDTVGVVKDELAVSDEILGLRKIQLSRIYKERLESINSSSALLYRILEHYKGQPGQDPRNLDELFNRWQWFELWTGLSPRDEINKMLTLNAGHKPVKTQHQLELLFNNMVAIFKAAKNKDFELIRERDVSSISYSKNRALGQFHFSHLITSILSFHEATPLTNNVQLIQKAQANDFDDTIFDSLINYDFLYIFIECVLAIDVAINNNYGTTGIRWIGRETSMVGMFAACGKFAQSNGLTPTDALYKLKDTIEQKPVALRLDAFEEERNKLDLAKVNIGSVNKRAVFRAVYDLLSNIVSVIEWSEYFNPEK
ncbi:hypothetical protein [Mucilaginibacter lappiensis]|uniref:DUF262 domain-containing protein n=1 Tax=Mucilaginibacter lappiensis TaxID=354630 RepID=A0A841JBY6_9SPHI|nr:hypothetical protein [Mucilaginibacter lappiensis]MBB6128633.1 hypothetical protein [Mucilaginibacter lappiensis]